jgi:hypothetical protein
MSFQHYKEPIRRVCNKALECRVKQCPHKIEHGDSPDCLGFHGSCYEFDSGRRVETECIGVNR